MRREEKKLDAVWERLINTHLPNDGFCFCVVFLFRGLYPRGPKCPSPAKAINATRCCFFLPWKFSILLGLSWTLNSLQLHALLFSDPVGNPASEQLIRSSRSATKINHWQTAWRKCQHIITNPPFTCSAPPRKKNLNIATIKLLLTLRNASRPDRPFQERAFCGCNSPPSRLRVPHGIANKHRPVISHFLSLS